MSGSHKTNQVFNYTTLSDKQLHKSLYIAVLLALLGTPSVGGTLMVMVGFYPMPEFYLTFFSYTGIYVACVIVGILSLTPRWYRGIIELTKLDHDLAMSRANKIFSRLPGYLFLFITLYSIFGALSVNFSLERMGVRQYTLQDHMYTLFGIIPVVLVSSFPIFFYFVDRLGRYLAPRGIYVTAVPLWLKLLMLGIVVPVLIDSLLIGYYYNRTAYFQAETLVLWLSLILLAMGGTWLAWRSLRQSISPLEAYIASHSNSVANVVDQSLTPLSLDELGVLTAQFDKLLTHQKLLTDNLQHERDFATSLVNTAPMIVLLLDSRGFIQYINPYFEQLGGYSLEEVKDKEWFSTFLPERDQDQIRELFYGAVNELEIRQNINPIVIHDGSERMIEWSAQITRDAEGMVTGLLSMGQDVTERIQTEEALHKSSAINEKIINESPIGLAIYDHTGQCIEANDSVAKLIGATREQVLSQNYKNIESWKKAGILEAANESIRLQRKERYEFELVTTFGKHATFDCLFMPFKLRDEQHLLLMLDDVTERKAIELKLEEYRGNLESLVVERTTELKNTHEELVRKERLATLGQLTATVSHELRNPLGAMKPSLYIIDKKSDRNDERLQLAIERIDRNVDRCDRIIDELLDFTRITDLEQRNTHVDEWLQLVINEQDIHKDIQIEKDLSLNDVESFIDSDRMRRAVINILENACHAMMDDAQQVLDKENSRLGIKSQINAERIEIIISDTGSGIPEDVLEKIFEPLFSTKGFGVGLGMPTVKQIMEQHGGGIEVNSEEGKGTSVILWLPLDIDEGATA